jgi:diacylglycerol kinase (ATP)
VIFFCRRFFPATSKEPTAMKRLIDAFFNSVRAFRRLAGSEAAFQQELILLLIAIPVGWLVAASWSGYALLLASILILILVEVLNTGIEATCNAVSRDFNIDIQLAKDCGSLAVLIAIVLTVGVWGFAIIGRLAGGPV